MAKRPGSPQPHCSKNSRSSSISNSVFASDLYRNRICRPCSLTFATHLELQQHIFIVHPEWYDSVQIGGGDPPPLQIEVLPILTSVGISTRYRAQFELFSCDSDTDERHFYNAVRASSVLHLQNDIKKWKNLRVVFTMKCVFVKEHVNKVWEYHMGNFTSFSHLIFNNHTITKVWDNVTHNLSSHIEDFTNEGSGWKLVGVIEFGFVTTKYKFTKIGSYIPTPYPLTEFRNCFLNIENTEVNITNDHNKCFVWSILAHRQLFGLTPTNRKRTRVNTKVKTYKQHVHELVLNGLTFPMTLEQISTFERLNPRISLTVLGYDLDGREPPNPPSINEEMTEEEVDQKMKKHKLKCFKHMQRKTSVLHNSKQKREIHVDLMCLMSDNNCHFILINNLELYMRSPNDRRTKNICRNCLQNFRDNDKLKGHEQYCAALGFQKVTYPCGERSEFKFDRFERTQPVPFMFSADFEALLKDYDREDLRELIRRREKESMQGLKPTDFVGGNNRTHIHIPSGFSWVCWDHHGKPIQKYTYRATYDGEDVAYKFIESITNYSKELEKKLDEYEIEANEKKLDDPIMREEFQRLNQKNCCFCKKQFTTEDKVVRHHLHLPPFNPVGLAHNECNLKAKIKKDFPVFLHNFSSYDLHFLVQSMGELKQKNIVSKVDVIAKSSEKYLTLTITPGSGKPNSNKRYITLEDETEEKSWNEDIEVQVDENDGDQDEGENEMEEEEEEDDEGEHLGSCKIRFVDSMGFTLKGLGELVEMMRKDSSNRFEITRDQFREEVESGGDIELLFQKGAYPYSLMKTCSDFERVSLPPKEDFFNDLKEEAIKDEVYEHAKKVWESFQIQNMGQWHDLYCRLDTSLLADVMQSVRRIIFDSYELDIGHYYSLPMLAIDAALKKSGVVLQLLTDPTMHVWFEQAIRGGYVSVGSLRSAKANNPYMGSEFDDSQPTTYLIYIDANNLYGKAMSSLLPTSEFSWWIPDAFELLQMERDIHGFMDNLEKDKSFGYVLEVDLEYPLSLHDHFNDYPPAPVSRTVQKEELSKEYQQPLINELGISNGIYKVKKLIADLMPKKNYILHQNALKQYLLMGVKLTKIHKGVSFRQSAWMKPFIDFNTQKRAAASSEFEKDFWKLLNNSAFGKTIEQVRNRQNVRIVTSKLEALRYNKKPTVNNVIPINASTCIFSLKKLVVKLNKPLYTGVSVLDISKTIMYQHHATMQRIYGKNCNVVYTDTDSFIYHVVTDDIYKDMAENWELYDMSKYPENHPYFRRFHSTVNKEVLGKFKDECAGAVMTHAVCPRPKMYTFRAVKIKELNDDKGNVVGYESDTDGNWIMEDCCKKKVKGITKAAVKNRISFDDFQRVIDNNDQTFVEMKGIRSVEHRIFTEATTKKALNGLDTKRFAVDSIKTLAFGHKDISK